MTEQEQYEDIKSRIDEQRNKLRSLLHLAYKAKDFQEAENCRVLIVGLDRRESELRKPNQ